MNKLYFSDHDPASNLIFFPLIEVQAEPVLESNDNTGKILVCLFTQNIFIVFLKCFFFFLESQSF